MSQRLRHERAAVQQKSKWRLVGVVFAGIIGVVVVLGAIGLILILHTTPPPVIHANHAAARRLADEMQRAQTAAAAGSPAIVRADETELNSTIEEYLREANRKLAGGASAAVPDMKLSLAEDRLRAYFLVNLQGKDISVVFEGKTHELGHYSGILRTSLYRSKAYLCDLMWIPGPGFLIVSRMPINPPHSEA